MANELDLVAAMTNAELTDFDGKKVVRAAVALFGTDGLSEAMAVNPMEIPQGTTGTCVIRWVCEEVKHKKVSKDTPDLLTRNHRLLVTTIAFADHKAITKMLDEQDEAIRKAKEKAKGIEALTAEDGTDPVGDAEKAHKARKRADAPADKGVVQSGEFKGEPYDPDKEAGRVRKPRTPAAAKASVDDAVKAAEKIRTSKLDSVEAPSDGASVTDIADARKAATSDGG